MSDAFIIAVDGPAASGKGTLARRLADHFGLRHLDTGGLYRAAAVRVLRTGGDPADATACEAAARNIAEKDLNSPKLRDEEVGQAASILSAHPAVREALLAYQRDFAGTPPGAVLDGRDIGTVVLTEAPTKIFLDAPAAERARRRQYDESAGDGSSVDSYETVLADLEARDARDREREDSPLRAAEDAHVIQSGRMSIEDVVVAVLAAAASDPLQRDS